MITTIQLDKKVKSKLSSLKKSKKETYEEVILDLIMSTEQSKRKNKELLIKGCKEMAEDNIKTAKEWESTDIKEWE